MAVKARLPGWLVAASLLLGGTEVARADQSRPKPAVEAKKPKPKCSRTIAADVTRADLRIVGMVERGKRRRVLLMDSRRNRGHIVAPGECAGRERVPFRDWLPSNAIPPNRGTVIAD